MADDPEELIDKLSRRSHSYRNYDPIEFRELVEKGVSKRELRTVMRVMESGRMESMLKAAHRFFAALDEDEQETFASRNPGMIFWINTYAMLEEMYTFEKYER